MLPSPSTRWRNWHIARVTCQRPGNCPDGREVLDLMAEGAARGGLSKSQFDRRAEIRRELAVRSARLSDPDPTGLSAAGKAALEKKRDGLRQDIQRLLSDEEQLDSEIRR